MDTASSATAVAAPTSAPVGDLAGALGIAPAQADGLRAFGVAAGQVAEQVLSTALAQPVRVGGALLQRMEPSEVEAEDWSRYHAVDVRWEAGGVTYASVLLLPKAELQTLLPSARGTAELPDMEALGRLLRDLADQLTAALQRHLAAPLRLSLADVSSAPHDTDQPMLRIEQRLTAGHEGATTDFGVIHLVPTAALQALAQNAVAAGTPSAASATGTTTSQDDPTQRSSGFAAAGGGVTEMEQNMASTQPATSVHGVQFQPFDGDGEPQGGTNLDLLLDVSLRVSVELGRTELSIKEVLALGPGSVVELDKLAGEPVDILVNNRLIAKGEVVVVDENFGVRVTDIISPKQLLGKLR